MIYALGELWWRARRAWSLLRLYWGTPDGDWSTLAVLMRHQLRRDRQHIASHDIIVDGPRVCRQMLIAEHVLDRLLCWSTYYDIARARYPEHGKHWSKMVGDIQAQDRELLGKMIGKHLDSWWD